MNISKDKKRFIPSQSRKKNPFNWNLLLSSNISIELFESLLSGNREIINKRDDKGETLLSLALSRNRHDLCRSILKNKLIQIDINYKDEEGNDYLHKAALNDNSDMIDLLIRRGIDINGQNKLGNTAMHIAAMKGNSKIIKLLLMNKAKASIENNNKETALVFAKREGSLRCINAISKTKCFSHLELNPNDINIYSNYLHERNKSVTYARGRDNGLNAGKDNLELLTIGQSETLPNKDTNDNEEKVNPQLIFDDIDDSNNINNESHLEPHLDGSNERIEETNEEEDDECNLQYSSSASSFNESFANEGEFMLIIHSNSNDIISNGGTPNFNRNYKPSTGNDKQVNVLSLEKSSSPPQFLSFQNTFKHPPDLNDNLLSLESNNEFTISNSSLQSFHEATANETSDLYGFLKDIHLEKYFSNLLVNGFDDILLMVHQTKTGLAITDANLKEAKVNQGGDRAKIIIHLQELALNFDFAFPKERVYHISSNIEHDHLIEAMSKWLSEIKMSHFLKAFIGQGYHSLDTLMMQMLSKQPLTDSFLENTLLIDKIGYRTRLINKFKEESRFYITKCKGKELLLEKSQSNTPTCQCLIF